MYKISEKWSQNIYKNNISILNIYVDGILLNPKYILDLKSGCELFDGDFELGATPCAYVELKIHKQSGIISPKKVKIEYGILINNALTIAELDKMLIKDANNLKIKSLSENDSSFEVIPMRNI